MEFIARQPIFDRNRNVVAYELLFRDSQENTYTGKDQTLCSKQTLATAMLIGLDPIANGRDIYLNCTEQVLLGGYPTLLPPDCTVVEVLENVEPTPEVVDSCKKLKDAGYRIALDDFEDREDYRPLIDLADIIKVDFKLSDQNKWAKFSDRYGKKHRLLAEKVETDDEFAKGSKLGYQFFQGYFFRKPKILSAHSIGALNPRHAELFKVLGSEELNFRDIERVVKSEPALCYRLLRYLNSAAFSFRSEIRSIMHALTLLGESEMRKFLMLAVTVLSGSAKKQELVSTALIRGRFAESLANDFKEEGYSLFIMGVLSMMDAILEVPIEVVVRQLAIPENVRQALMGEDGKLRDCLDLVLAYEAADWDQCDAICRCHSLDRERMGHMYLDTLRWTKPLVSD